MPSVVRSSQLLLPTLREATTATDSTWLAWMSRATCCPHRASRTVEVVRISELAERAC